MAMYNALIASILISSLVIGHFVEADELSDTNVIGRAPLQKIDCGAACAARCKLSSRPNLCQRACGSCCARCNCVPPGTSGNKDVCPCYANMTTHGGRPKCP